MTKKIEKNNEETNVKENENMKEDIIMAAADEYEDIDLGEDEAPASAFLEEDDIEEIEVIEEDIEATEIVEDEEIRTRPIERQDTPAKKSGGRRGRSASARKAIPKNKSDESLKTAIKSSVEATKEHVAEKEDQSSEKRYISRTGRLQARTEANERNEAIIDLVRSFKNNVVLEGTVVGIEPVGDKDWAAIVMYGPFKVIIPSGHMIEYPPFDKNIGYRDEFHMKEKMLEKRINSKISFIVMGDPDDVNDIAGGSRLAAMSKLSKINYIQKDQYGKPLVYEGAKVEARVMAVVKTGIYVDVLGVDTYINIRELSYSRLYDATKAGFYNGQSILVKVTSIDKSNRDKIKIKASYKATKEDPQKLLVPRILIGSQYGGKVTNMTKHGIYVALSNGAECLCAYPTRGDMPYIDGRVVVKISNVDYEKSRLMGNITQVTLDTQAI